MSTAGIARPDQASTVRRSAYGHTFQSEQGLKEGDTRARRTYCFGPPAEAGGEDSPVVGLRNGSWSKMTNRSKSG